MWEEFCEVYSPNNEGFIQCQYNCKECKKYKKYIKKKNRKLLLWLVFSLVLLNTFGILFNKITPDPSLALWMCGFMSGGLLGVYYIERSDLLRRQ